MGLLENPPTRPRTYVEGEPVDPNDFNEIFDRIISNVVRLDDIDLYFTSTETRQLNVGSGSTSFGTHAASYEESTGAAQVVNIVIDLPVGAKIYGYSFRYKGNGANNLDHRLVKATDDAEVPVGAATIVAPAAAWATAFNNFAPETVALGTVYLIRVTAGGGLQRVGAPAVDWTRPKP